MPSPFIDVSGYAGSRYKQSTGLQSSGGLGANRGTWGPAADLPAHLLPKVHGYQGYNPYTGITTGLGLAGVAGAINPGNVEAVANALGGGRPWTAPRKMQLPNGTSIDVNSQDEWDRLYKNYYPQRPAAPQQPAAGGGGFMAGLRRYAEGGYAGDGGTHEAKGIVEGGEVVIPKDKVQAMGGPAALCKALGLPAPGDEGDGSMTPGAMGMLKRYADGGAVPGYVPGVGIDVSGYAGSRYDEDFARNNPGPTDEDPNLIIARQRLLAAAGKVPGRNYTPELLARATPAQILAEAALLPERLGQVQQVKEQKAVQAAASPRTVTSSRPRTAEEGAFVMQDPNVTSSQQVDPNQSQAVLAYLRAGGNSKGVLDAFKELPKADDNPSLQYVEDPQTGARFALGPKGNFASSGTNPAKAKPAAQTIDVGGRKLTVGPGNKYFDEKGQPVDFGQEKPMSATDWIIAGNKPEDYQDYRTKFDKAVGAAPVADGGGKASAVDLSKPLTPEQAANLPKGTRFTGQNGKTYVKN